MSEISPYLEAIKHRYDLGSDYALADKLGISRRQCRRVLEELAEQGIVRRHEFVDIEPLYTRFPSR